MSLVPRCRRLTQTPLSMGRPALRPFVPVAGAGVGCVPHTHKITQSDFMKGRWGKPSAPSDLPVISTEGDATLGEGVAAGQGYFGLLHTQVLTTEAHGTHSDSPRPRALISHLLPPPSPIPASMHTHLDQGNHRHSHLIQSQLQILASLSRVNHPAMASVSKLWRASLRSGLFLSTRRLMGGEPFVVALAGEDESRTPTSSVSVGRVAVRRVGGWCGVTPLPDRHISTSQVSLLGGDGKWSELMPLP